MLLIDNLTVCSRKFAIRAVSVSFLRKLVKKKMQQIRITDEYKVIITRTIEWIDLQQSKS